jgi:hypothetical protein
MVVKTTTGGDGFMLDDTTTTQFAAVCSLQPTAYSLRIFAEGEKRL